VTLRQHAAVAAFDFDGTLTRGDSLVSFLHFSAGPARMATEFLRLLPLLAGYGLGRVDNQVAKEAVLTRFFSGMEQQQLAELGARFARQKIGALLRPDGVPRLRWHQQQGHYCVLVSASLDIYLQPWAQDMGFDAVLCSRLACDSERRITGRLAGANCYGPEKTRRLRELVGEPATLYAYGDSRGDRELLAMADHAYYRRMPGPGES